MEKYGEGKKNQNQTGGLGKEEMEVITQFEHYKIVCLLCCLGLCVWDCCVFSVLDFFTKLCPLTVVLLACILVSTFWYVVTLSCS